MISPDILIDVKFYESDKNGRSQPTAKNFFACPFEVDKNKHDCRLLLDKIGSIKPGDFKKEVPVKFLSPDLVMPKLHVGKKFYLWEFGYIAEGIVTKIFKTNFQKTT